MSTYTKMLLSLFVLASFTIKAQDKMISKTRTIKVNEKPIAVESNNSYNILTGEKIEQKELNRLIRNNPDVFMEQEFDKYGHFVRFWFNPNKKMGVPTTIGRTPSGEKFPEFSFTTSEGIEIDSNSLQGKWVIIRFEGYPEDFMFKADEVKDLDEQITSFNENGKQVVAFDIFGWGTEKAEKIFTVYPSNFHIIPNGRNFERKFKIIRNPKTLVINPEGVLMGYYNYSEDIDLIALSKD